MVPGKGVVRRASLAHHKSNHPEQMSLKGECVEGLNPVVIR